MKPLTEDPSSKPSVPKPKGGGIKERNFPTCCIGSSQISISNELPILFDGNLTNPR